MIGSDEHQTPPGNARPRRRPLVWVGVVLCALVAGAVAAIVVVAGGGSRAARSPIGRRPGPDRGLDVVPFPGTPDASPRTQIIFPALARAEIRSMVVSGSRSGRHAGRLAALPGRQGTAFAVRRKFSSGERVSVVAHLASRAAGRASGAGNARELRFSFKVTKHTSGAVRSEKASGHATSAKPGKQPPTRTFHSAPGLHPPVVRVTGDPDHSSGDVFITAQDSPQAGPMILDGSGRTVWFDPLHNTHLSATDLSVQRYRHKSVLTWWQGRIVNGYGTEGKDFILSESYRRIAALRGAEGYSTDAHDFQLTSRGTALVTVFAAVKANLSSVRGPTNGTVLDGIVQELDVRTGRLLWEWHALGHVPLTASEIGKATAHTPYDFFHINSVQELPDGNLIISARNTWAVYEVSRSTGRVIWTLGGKRSSFQMGQGTKFSWQHDARLHSDGTLSLFDDGASPKEESESRGLTLNLDLRTMRATLARAYTHRPSVLASAEGSTQILPNGNVFVGWGTEPYFSEYTPNGRQIWDGSFTNTVVESYRAYRWSWRGQPTRPPAISATAGSGGAVTVYASWNGATDVARWQLVAGSSAKNLSPVAAVKSAGFETAIHAKTSRRYLAVRALSTSGRVLATSKVVLAR